MACKNLQEMIEMYLPLPFRLCKQNTSLDFTSAQLPQGCPDLFTNRHESSWHHIDNANRWPKVGSTSCGMSERNITNDPPSWGPTCASCIKLPTSSRFQQHTQTQIIEIRFDYATKHCTESLYMIKAKCSLKFSLSIRGQIWVPTSLTCTQINN